MPETLVADAAATTSTERPPTSGSRRAQAVALLALLASAGYLVWRWGFTVLGADLWLAIPLVLAETYGLTMIALLTYSCWRLSERPQPAPLPGRSVAVMVATYDEPEDILRPTIVGALAIRHEGPFEVCVCDDGSRDWVREMCESLGVRYFTRPEPRTHAKAGNLNNGLQHVEAEFLVTLDADHVPRPELLERMLGYMADPKVGLVQGPQAFYNRGFGHPRTHEDPLFNEQSIFFDIICRGKDRHSAAFWCGCPSVIRRAALDEVGGVATETICEDAHTSLKMNVHGWRVVYHDEVMAFGLAPEEISAFVVQRARWARGSIQMLRKEFPPLRRGLTRHQRLEYTASCLHFFEGVARLIGLLVPAVVLATGAIPLHADPLLYATVFAPGFVLTPLASWALTRGRYRPMEGERYAVVRMEGYIRALAALPRGTGGGFKVTPKGARKDAAPVLRVLRLPLAVAALTLAALGAQVAGQLLDLPNKLSPGTSAVSTLWGFINVALIVYTAFWATGVHHRRRSHRFPVSVEAAYATLEGALPSLVGHVDDLSRHGARLTVPDARTPGERVHLVMLLDDGPIEVTGSIATVDPARGGEGWRVGVDFDPMDGPHADAIVAWCFRNPFGPETPVTSVEPGTVTVPPLRALAPALLAAAETASTSSDASPPPAVSGETSAA